MFYLHFLNDVINHHRCLNNWFVIDIILDLEMLNPSFINYKKAIIQHIIDELIDQEQSIYNCVY